MIQGFFDFANDNGLKTLQLNQKNKNLEEVFLGKSTKNRIHFANKKPV